jgi:DNA polymerase I-like protein with 3'-5' exonuclease and polymerase domains
MPVAEGEEWITRWARRFPVAWDFIQQCRRAPLDRKALVTCFGRKRRFSVISRNNVHAVQNEASNFPHQSTASDITLVAHTDLIEDPRYNGNVVNLIHDAGLHELLDNPDTLDRQVALIIYYMEKTGREWGLTKVPFKAEAKSGLQWGFLKPYTVKGSYNFETIQHQ